MKKRGKKEVPKKEKQFNTAPFKALKGFAPDSLQTKESAPAPKSTALPGQSIERDDSDLFLKYMDDVKRLDGTVERKRQQLHREEQSDSVVNEEERQTFLASLAGMDVTFRDEFPDMEQVKPLAVNRMRQLKSGAIRIDFELDLHGLTRDEALRSLETFILGAYSRCQKAVLVITGKGINSPAEPVLQGAVASWLREAGKKMVAEFAPAPRKMGGSGAYVVFLKERKDAEQQ